MTWTGCWTPPPGAAGRWPASSRTLEAVNRNAVQHLYIVRTFERSGAVCGGCGALQPPAPGRCRFCGGGEVSVVERHAGLAGRDGVGAILLYAA